ncbi:hypothetical protein ES703_116179 [subsurface metagenome]
MSECYTIGGDSYAYIIGSARSAETFIPLSTFIVHWVDLTIQLTHLQSGIVIHLYETDEFHHPTGPFISRSVGMDYPSPWAWLIKRTRFPMTKQTLEKGKEYVFTAATFPPAPYPGHYCQYDYGDATYPRGMRLSTLDGGDTWTDHPNDNLIFAVFGSPPSPPPPPNPPIDKFAILDVEQEITKTGIKFLVTTNVPCFLKMYWTNIEPEKHFRAMLRRGMFWKNAIRYCFVDWHENDQEELSEGLYHTFIKEPWAHCETRWFTFRAKVNGEWSPSVGPIFKKHRIKPKWAMCLTEPWTVPVFPPPLERCLLEPWTDGGMFMRLAEHWIIPSFPPPFESGILETWPTATWPPEFNLLFKETW